MTDHDETLLLKIIYVIADGEGEKYTDKTFEYTYTFASTEAHTDKPGQWLFAKLFLKLAICGDLIYYSVRDGHDVLLYLHYSSSKRVSYITT